MALQTWVARFVVDHGRVTEEGGRLRTFQRRRLDEPDVDLHILAEPQGAKGAELAAQALEAIGRLFLADRLSLTGGLSKALRSTHQTLVDWNRRSLPNEQASTGITCAVVNGPVVYLAQAGQTLVYLRRSGGRLERLEPDPTNLEPLGVGDLEPAIRRIDLAAGDIILAASMEMAKFLDYTMLTALLDRGTDQALPELYLYTRDLPDFALFLITCQDLEPAEAESRSHFDFEDSGPVTREQALPEKPNPSPPPPPPPPVVDESTTTLTETPPRQAAPQRQKPPRRRRPDPEFVEEPMELPERPEPPPEPFLMAPPPVDISRSIIRLRNDGSRGGNEYARTTGPQRRGINLGFADGKLLRIGAALAVLIVVVAFVPGLVKQRRTENVGTLVENAQQQFALAGQTADPAQKRSYLEETRRLSSEALRNEPDNATATDLRQQATTSLNALDAIFDLGAMKTITTLSRQVTGDVSISSLIVSGGTAYLLDSKGGRVIGVTIGASGPPTILFQEGESYRGTPAKRPMYFTWEAQAGRVLVLDADRKLFAVRANDTPEPLPLRRSGTWQSVAGMAAYDGNLYVLDPKGKQIYRYLPAAAGFDSEPSSAITGSADLSDAQNLVVDGDIFVIGREGQVKRFKGGTDVGFPFSGLDRPLKGSISSIAVLSAANEVYVADSGNKRIVVATREGVFRRQLVSNAFTDMRSLALDPSTSQIYVVVGDALLSAPLPK
jgi:type II secretory pathway pseudopilin PulG